MPSLAIPIPPPPSPSPSPSFSPGPAPYPLAFAAAQAIRVTIRRISPTAAPHLTFVSPPTSTSTQHSRPSSVSSDATFTSLSSLSSATSGTPSSTPTRLPALRRKHSPRSETLRQIRDRQSEACLRQVYEEHVEAYVSGRIVGRQFMLLGGGKGG